MDRERKPIGAGRMVTPATVGYVNGMGKAFCRYLGRFSAANPVGRCQRPTSFEF
jgi:hypothetical protein